jgi:hypothetical protein
MLAALTNLSIKGYLALVALVSSLVALATPRLRRLSRPQTAAEFIEVALYAVIILILATVFREPLRGAFEGVRDRIVAGLNTK